ncbi:hypothetical protein [Variovorax sp. UMC13]|uniref:hypothetical protein n=1 Tax=Variovorax sp. UMC13 TaxID=1862326 RepID=UPI001601BA57|nr:hypothetical protein [Variovorax sp. UMC13]MBB1599950.1 hypothetical protein [Variovorax sp. UMC13]
MRTLDLFNDPAPPYQCHSATSRAAAERIAPAAGTKRADVLAYIKGCGAEGATDEEMQRGMPMPANTQRPRRIERVQMGFVTWGGATRAAVSGDHALVWVVAP